jgi:hypothetical protein
LDSTKNDIDIFLDIGIGLGSGKDLCIQCNLEIYGVTQTKEYTWLGVNDMQVILWKVKQGFETNKRGFRSLVLEKY